MSISEIDVEYEEGSYWRPPDYNRFTFLSLEYQRAWETKHGDDGIHRDLLIPMEAAICSVGPFSVVDATPGIDSITNPAAGRYVLTLNAPGMINADDWFVHVWPGFLSGTEPAFAYESEQVGATAKDLVTVEFRIVNRSGSLANADFWVGVYGERGF